MTTKWAGQLGLKRRDPTHVRSVLSDPCRHSPVGGAPGVPRAGAVTRAPVRASTGTSPPCVTYTVSRGKSQDGFRVTKTGFRVTSVSNPGDETKGGCANGE